MQITLSNSTLVLILIAVVVVGLLLRLLIVRRAPRTNRPPKKGRSRRATPPRAGQPRRTTPPRAGRSRRIAPSRGGWGWWRGTPERGDKGAEVAQKYGRARSPQWPEVAREHLLHQPGCAACGYEGQGLQVHHIRPFHLFPQLELDPTNLITLCEVKGRDHHLLLGHLDDWESYNLNVREDVGRFHNEKAKKIRANPTWQKEVQNRPVPGGEVRSHSNTSRT